MVCAMCWTRACVCKCVRRGSYPAAPKTHLLDWMARCLLRVELLISHRLPSEQIKAAYNGLLHQPDVYTGVGLVWG